MTETEQSNRARTATVLLQPARWTLHAVIKAVVLAYMATRRALRPKPARYGLLALIVVGFLGWHFAGTATRGQQRADGNQDSVIVSASPESLLPPSAVVEGYLRAQASFDAKGMWDCFGSELKQAMQASGGTMQQLQAELDNARQQGRRYRKAIYVGGTPMSENRKVYFYVLTVDTPLGSTDVPYIYVVNQEEKIESIQ